MTGGEGGLELLRRLGLAAGAVPLVDAAAGAADLTGAFAAVARRNEQQAPTGRLTRRLANLVVGAVAEHEFQRRYSEAMRGQEFSFRDERTASSETDFLVLNGRGRPAFRINIKAHGTFFEQAKRFVGLEPEDTFALATYKIRDANRRSAAEALPFLFAIVSSERLATGPLVDALPPDAVELARTATLYTGLKGWRAVENALVEVLLAEADAVAALREAAAAANWRAISAVKAQHLLNERLWERVPAVATRNFSGNRESQPNMHFSLAADMVALDEFLALLRDHGIQHVATKIAYREI